MQWDERIVIDPEVRSGKPCIRGTRITVYDVLEYLAGGMTEDELLDDCLYRGSNPCLQAGLFSTSIPGKG